MPVRATLRLSPQDAAVALNSGIVGLNMVQMQRAGPNRPRVMQLIRERKLRYTRHDPAEHWQTYDEVMAQIQRHGFALADCEDISSMLAAEMRLGDGELVDPQAHVTVRRTGAQMSHVEVGSPQLGSLDPSAWAGMGWDEPSEENAAAYRTIAGMPGDPDGLAGGWGVSGAPLQQLGCPGCGGKCGGQRMGCSQNMGAHLVVPPVTVHPGNDLLGILAAELMRRP